jgi:hypothetical protein
MEALIMIGKILFYIGFSIGGLWFCYGIVKYGQEVKKQKIKDYYESIDRTRNN